MNKYIRKPYILLYSEMPKPKDKDIFIFGSKETKKNGSDTAQLAMSRYIGDCGITPEQAAAILGIGRTTLYNYLADTRELTYSMLCVICIGLKLHPDRQRHLFHLCHIERPDREYSTDPRDLIIIEYLEECAFDNAYSLDACNKSLKDGKQKMLHPYCLGTEDRK
jgi:transcriptional regulator with XRE-family HTH domain